mmetsp:Transcript_90507/g.156924  ORF Transcript_90507/g.156924 Transcript_90507/m.156924 type:complete len:268 (-) Transcript_90507:395-1198(-)
MTICMARVEMSCKLVLHLRLFPLLSLRIHDTQVEVDVCILDVMDQGLLQHCRCLLQVFLLNVSTSQLQQTNCHILVRLLAILVGLQSHRICLHSIVKLSEGAASDSEVIPSLHIPRIEPHSFSVHLLGAGIVTGLRVFHTKLEACSPAALASLQGIMKELGPRKSGRLELYASLREAASKLRLHLHIARLGSEHLLQTCCGVLPAELLDEHCNLALQCTLKMWVPLQCRLETSYGLVLLAKLHEALTLPVMQFCSLRLEPQRLVDEG